jgi:hypothetical protein
MGQCLQENLLSYALAVAIDYLVSDASDNKQLL